MKAFQKKQKVAEEIAALAAEADALAGTIGEWAEAPFQETRSSKGIAEFLARHGFKADFCFKAMPTAFRAVWGAGRPRVGILGEYDALPDCGPGKGDWGHGCGHNLLGAGSAAGAVAAARVAARAGLSGTIVYYGCPAEETLAGKAYMARDGAFRDLDACLAWHPGATTEVSYCGGSALDSLAYEFFGRTAHAAHPVGSKSALDAAILFDIAVNYLREALPENVRIHSVIVKGGDAPNVVPAYAKSWYYIRGKDRAQVDEMRGLVDRCARGAAIATGTRFRRTRLTGIYSRLPNDALFALLHDNLALFGAAPVTPADRKRAQTLGLKGDFNVKVRPAEKGSAGRASSDEDTVSWLAPLGRFKMTTHATGTTGHHRQLAAQMALPFALRGMRQAAKVLAGAALDLLSSPAQIAKIRKEFLSRTRGRSFDPLIPRGQKPPVGQTSGG